MTHLYNDPVDFKNEAMDGFAAAFARYVERVPDASGFLRRGGPREGKVSLVVGGGSGHYPSYGGIVGRGFADGCVLGDVFTSPSTEQIRRVARAADGGAGIVLAFGNYAGDRLNFGAAQERLREEGVDTRVVFVTDDIASASAADREQRRGIAGTFAVYKIGGAAADAGHDLDTVQRLMQAANDATFSFGVAFHGCTFPGQDDPLFTVETAQMELGLGIHGEPGIETVPWMPARELADLLVDPVLKERPANSGARAAVVVNGLGATKYEELFLLYGHIHARLVAAGIDAVLPEVGELVTSLDMAGCSLSITWLDEELERHWSAPADTVAFRRGELGTEQSFAARSATTIDEGATVRTVEASDASREAAAVARRALTGMLEVVHAHSERLGRIDAVAGDGDHGVGMTRGLRAAVEAAEATDGGIGSVIAAAGDAFGDRAGGTSGSLWAGLLNAVADELGDTEPVTGPLLARAVRRGADAVQSAGKAALGDKTMLDAMFPFVDALDARIEAGEDIAPAWRSAAEACVQAADATASLTPKIGRARPLAERSVGTPDAGAVSMGLIVTSVGDDLTEACGAS